MSSHQAPGNTPTLNEVRVVERDGKRWLQQWRRKPGGYLYEYDWIDIVQLPSTPNVRPIPR
jgi:hypothetical protein